MPNYYFPVKPLLPLSSMTIVYISGGPCKTCLSVYTTIPHHPKQLNLSPLIMASFWAWNCNIARF